mmetsp:Transcript_28564/g.51736  ORF Transcript_28564/g.51736 Transcript_28564/m.51736 type:complete len:764 (+) Transcript_28564:64-2355(+)
MEVRLEALEGSVAPKEAFVAVRIGDVQKQSRYSSSKIYRFPDPGDARSGVGRIEVFQRLGHVTVNFESRDGKLQDIEVPLESAETDSLRMRLAITGAKAESPSKKSKAKSKLDAAQRYVEDHKLEEILADAMREVIHEKPSDPHRFLSNQILKHASTRLPPIQIPAPASGKKIENEQKREKLPPLKSGLAEQQKTAKDLPMDALALIESFELALAESAAGTVEAEKVEEVLPEDEAPAAAAKQEPPEEAPLAASAQFTGSAAERRLQMLLNAAQDSPDRMATVIREKSASKPLPVTSSEEPSQKALIEGFEQALAESSADREVEDLRQQAADTLLRAAGDGSLEKVLQESSAAAKVDEMEDLRRQAADTLLKAAGDGSLATVLRESSASAKADEIEDLRQQAADTLLSAAADGRLAAVLQESSSSVDREVDDLRKQVADSLLSAAGDGRLAAALQDSSAESHVDFLRKQAANTLLSAAQDGRLAAVLQESSVDREIEDLRKQAANSLLSAATDGSLAAVLQESSAEKEIDDLRKQAADTLLSAAADGRLAAVLGESSEKAGAKSEDEEKLAFLREQARITLLESAQNGKLEAAVADAKKVAEAVVTDSKPMQDDLEAARTQARDALLEAVGNGSLQKALSEVETNKQSFKYTPSVGTWLQKTPFKAGVDRPSTVATDEAISKLQNEIAEKDAEIVAIQDVLQRSYRAASKKAAELEPLDSIEISHATHDMLLTLDSEALISSFEKERHRKEEEIQKLREMAGE